MSDTFTPHFNLDKPAIGGDPNTWGGLLNGDFDIIDSAMYANQQAAAAAQTAADAASAKVDTVTPVGAIIFWDLNKGAIPTGWQICDGTNGTPSTLGLFIVSSTGASGIYPNRGTGGVTSQTLSISNLPAHNHPLVDNGHSHSANNPPHTHGLAQDPHVHAAQDGGWGQAGTDNNGITAASAPNQYGARSAQPTQAATINLAVQTASANVSVNPNGTGIGIGNTGNGAAFDNRPQYIALVMIQRIS